MDENTIIDQLEELIERFGVQNGETVITGSFNFTKAAEENNAENLLVIRDRKLAKRYIKNWQEHERHSEVYGGRGK